mgnify:CR=1 FL=1
MKNLLKLGQGPRPDLLFEEEEKAKKSDTQPDGQKKKIEFEKGLRTVRKEAKKKAREEKKKTGTDRDEPKRQTGSYSGIL